MRVMALFSTSFFAKYLRVGEDDPGRGHLCHTDTFLVSTVNCHRTTHGDEGQIAEHYFTTAKLD